jgi:hypothetical protein
MLISFDGLNLRTSPAIAEQMMSTIQYKPTQIISLFLVNCVIQIFLNVNLFNSNS